MKMYKIIKLSIITSLLLLTNLAVSISAQILPNDTNGHYEISTDLIGLKETKTHQLLSQREYNEILLILKTLENNILNAKTNKEAQYHLEKSLEQLDHYNLFGNKDINIIKKMCTNQHKILNTLTNPNIINNQPNLVGGDNAFCVLISHVKGYVYDHGLFFIMAVLVALGALPFIVMFYPLGMILNFISQRIFSIQHKKPLIPPFPHRVETRYNESSSNLVSRGLYGRVHNDYSNWGFRFDVFTGIRINLNRDETLRINESYYIGSALFVSWNYDGPH
jgi:hypothetical protein